MLVPNAVIYYDWNSVQDVMLALNEIWILDETLVLNEVIQQNGSSIPSEPLSLDEMLDLNAVTQ